MSGEDSALIPSSSTYILLKWCYQIVGIVLVSHYNTCLNYFF